MYNAITELFLSTYYMFEGVATKLVGEPKTLFNKLYSEFLLPKTEQEDLYNATKTTTVDEIKTYGDYAQVCRIQKFMQLSERNTPAEIQEMIAIKGIALKKIHQIGLEEYTDSTATSICKVLNDTANKGDVSCLCMLGFLQCEGFYVSKDLKFGKKNLTKAANWNSIEGLLLALKYDEENRQENLDRLSTLTQGSLYESLIDLAKQEYNLDQPKQNSECKLLRKAFGQDIVKDQTYMPQYARILFSKVLGYKDKERILFAKNNEEISSMSDLPLKLSFNEMKFDLTAFDNLPLVREKEQAKISSLISCVDLCKDSTYRPICFSVESNYLSNLYYQAICDSVKNVHIEKIDVCDLTEYDLQHNLTNVFVRSCDENKQNIFILRLSGDIKESLLNEVQNFLQTEKRRKFRLQFPNLVIDLSSVLPICICDKQNARLLKSYCDTINISPINESEKHDIVRYMLGVKAKKYKTGDICICESAEPILNRQSIDKIESLIDRALRHNRGQQTINITAELLNEISSDILTRQSKFGFGGAENENK